MPKALFAVAALGAALCVIAIDTDASDAQTGVQTILFSRPCRRHRELFQ